jgi:hypothetical protein
LAAGGRKLKTVLVAVFLAIVTLYFYRVGIFVAISVGCALPLRVLLRVKMVRPRLIGGQSMSAPRLRVMIRVLDRRRNANTMPATY